MGQPTKITDPQALGQDLWAPWCGGLTGFTVRQQADFTGASSVKARQYLLTFPTADDAHRAYQKIVDGRSDCAAAWKDGQSQRGVPADSVMTQSATATSASAWLWHWTGFTSPVTTDGPQISHEYLVQRGPVLAVLEFGEQLSSINALPAYDGTGDAATLTAMTDHLCTLPGGCP